jgi:hypothetical protein
VLGTEAEKLVWTGSQISYEPDGLGHAVDPAAGRANSFVLAYAVCGQAVRVWREQHFDPAAAHMHAGCVTQAQPGSGTDVGGVPTRSRPAP